MKIGIMSPDLRLRIVRIVRIVTILLLAALVFPSISKAGQLEDGKAAYVRHDCEAARRLLQPLADQGSAPAQVVIGNLYQDGCGVRRDDAQAYTWYRKAADQENPEAQYRIAELRWNHEQDHSEAMKLIRRAAEGGYPEAMVQVGQNYERGECCGVKRDYVEALKWFRMAADRGDAQGQFHLGFMYLYGLGVPKDCTETMEWFRKAADQGYRNAQAQMGDMYSTGSCDVRKDYSEAYFWHSLPGAKLNSPGAAEADASNLTAEQIAAVKKRVNNWSPTSQRSE